MSDVSALLPVCCSRRAVGRCASGDAVRPSDAVHAPARITDLAEQHSRKHRVLSPGRIGYAVKNARDRSKTRPAARMLRACGSCTIASAMLTGIRDRCSCCGDVPQRSGRRNFGRRSSRWCRRGRSIYSLAVFVAIRRNENSTRCSRSACFLFGHVPAAREHSERVIERRDVSAPRFSRAAFSEPGTFSTSVSPG